MKIIADGVECYDNPVEACPLGECPHPYHNFHINKFGSPCPGCGEEKVWLEYSPEDGEWHIR